MTETQANFLGAMVANVDMLPGAQDPENAFMHAMAPANECSVTDRMSAQEMYLSYLSEQLSLGSLAGLAQALHAIQDSYASGHVGFPPYSGPGDVDLMHALGDMFPSQNSVTAAEFATQNTINQWLGSGNSFR